ncbi:Rrf2 family transcriptional regulator [Gordonia sp. LSe1-13]|uniref:Rrf2 family transcriptional regulator n=1 Tax=Gordonia sesuvii TaxID=3116777 RepID=A0ABU7MI32_9ACTN|nr:Rrf2 family transcriptional regulator [Gordonia sp. LSe1-13]
MSSSDGVVEFGQQIGPWVVEIEWPTDPNQLGPTSITVTPAEGATEAEIMSGISSTVLRQIDFGQLRMDWEMVSEMHAGQSREAKKRALGEQLRLSLEGGVTEHYLARLAEAYVFLVQSGERSTATRLAEMTGRSPDTVKQHLHRVRKAGLLSSIPGKAGGTLTEKARRLLDVSDNVALVEMPPKVVD